MSTIYYFLMASSSIIHHVTKLSQTGLMNLTIGLVFFAGLQSLNSVEDLGDVVEHSIHSMRVLLKILQELCDAVNKKNESQRNVSVSCKIHATKN